MFLNDHINALPISITKSLILNRNFEEHDALEDFGYKYIGILLTGYCSWLKNEFKKEKFEKIVFNSRDGYMPMQFFKKFYPEFNVDYLYTSRRAFLFSGMDKVKTKLEYLVDQIGNGVSILDYWKSIEIDDENIKALLFDEFGENEVINDEGRDKLKEFFKNNEKSVKEYAKKERNITIKYFKEMGILNKKVAMVDIGWRASIQRNIISTLKLAHKSNNIQGYYLATHPCKQGDIKLKTYLMNQNNPSNIAEVLNSIIEILELSFSAPHLGCIKIIKKNGKLEPLFAKENACESDRMKANEKIMNGALGFANDFVNITKNLELNISRDEAIVPFIHFYKNVSKEILNGFGEIKFIRGCGDLKNYNESVVQNFSRENSFSLVFTWPGSVQSGEVEFANRLKEAARNIGYKIAIISKEGNILDNYYNKTPMKLDPQSVMFNIIMHYEDFKMNDIFTYKALWNPPEILLRNDCYNTLKNNVVSNDDFFKYDDGGMTNHLKAMLIDSPRNLENASFLTASFPKTAALKTNLDNPTLFYCGINWEKMIGAAPRHEGLFNLLDKLDNVKFYGPKSTWEGHKNYKGKIPFDGFSLINECNKCGVVLALSSDWHYRSGAATNRVYEGCASGAVIISDDNPFIKKHFGDSILYIDFNKNNPTRMFEQIKQHLDWIKNNKEEAYKLAQKSQQIFLEKFTLEKQLTDIINNHENRERAVADALYSKEPEAKTLAILFADFAEFNTDVGVYIKNAINNIENQIEKNIKLIICCDKKIKHQTATIINNFKTNLDFEIKTFDIYNTNNYKLLSRCQMLMDIVGKEDFKYLCILNGNEILFQDHITTLKRILNDNKEIMASYGGTLLDSLDNNRYRILSSPLSKEQIYNGINYGGHFILSSDFLIRKEAFDFLPEYTFQYLDGCEVVALINLLIFKHNLKIKYSNRITNCFTEWINQVPDKTLDICMQLNLIKGMVQDSIPNVDNYQTPQQYENNFKMYNTHGFINYLLKRYAKKLYQRYVILKLRKLFEPSRKKRLQLKTRIRDTRNLIRTIR